ncbi:MAG: hypothetical protein MJ252_23615 [archaeon]|nr:hypothetical protein [archaeon]
MHYSKYDYNDANRNEDTLNDEGRCNSHSPDNCRCRCHNTLRSYASTGNIHKTNSNCYNTVPMKPNKDTECYGNTLPDYYKGNIPQRMNQNEEEEYPNKAMLNNCRSLPMSEFSKYQRNQKRDPSKDLDNLNADLIDLKRKLQAEKNSLFNSRFKSNRMNDDYSQRKNEPSKTYETSAEKNRSRDNLYKGNQFNKGYSPAVNPSNEDKSKDFLIDFLKKKINSLTEELDQLKKQNILNNQKAQRKEEEEANYPEIINKQNEIIDKLQNQLDKSQENCKSLAKRNSKMKEYIENSRRNSNASSNAGTSRPKLRMVRNINLYVPSSDNNKSLSQSKNLSNQISNQMNSSQNKNPNVNPYSSTGMKKTTTTTTEKTFKFGGPGGKKLFDRLKIKGDLSVEETKIDKFQINDNSKLGFNLPETLDQIVCFDLNDKKHHLLNYADYNEFQKNHKPNLEEKEEVPILTHKNTFYILTGPNHDILYSYNPYNNSMNKICKLINNHKGGVLVPNEKNSNELICLSGAYNKKVEFINLGDKTSQEVNEMNIERTKFNVIYFNEDYLFALFGFNALTSKFINSVEYLNLENIEEGWKYLKFKNEESIPFGIRNFFSAEYKKKMIIIFGGVLENNENNSNFLFLQFDNNQGNFENCSLQLTDRMAKDFEKNKIYEFGNTPNYFWNEDSIDKGFAFNFDFKHNFHLLQTSNLAHDVYNFKEKILDKDKGLINDEGEEGEPDADNMDE